MKIPNSSNCVGVGAGSFGRADEGYLVRIKRRVLTSKCIRFVLFRVRYWYFVGIRKQLRTISSEDAFDVTVAHNLRSIRKWSPRMELLIRPLSVIESVSKHAKILVVGPRNEYDLILLAGYGFSFRNIRGLDLISYSP